MIDFGLVDKFGLEKLVEIGASFGKQISHEKMNRKKRNTVKRNYGDTLKYLLESKRYELTKDLVYLLSGAFDPTAQTMKASKNIQWILTRKRYKELSAFVRNMVLSEETYQLLYALSRDTEEKEIDPKTEQHIRDTIHNVLKDCEVTYTPGEEETKELGFFVQEG